jgi:methyl-accepting chemotaxis protein
VIKPINEASGVLQEVAKGNLQVYVAGNYQGDHAQIKDALNRTIESLRKHIEEISGALTEMSRGNLNIEISNTYEGDFTQIQDSLRLIIDSFNQIINKMDASAEQINSGAKQVATSSQNLSQGSTEQAGAIEEISSSIRDIAEQTKQNALNANKANELSEDEFKHLEEESQKLTDKFIAEIDKLAEDKAKEILTV